MKISFTNEDEIKTFSDKQKQNKTSGDPYQRQRKMRHTRIQKEQIKWRYALWKKVIQVQCFCYYVLILSFILKMENSFTWN